MCQSGDGHARFELGRGEKDRLGWLVTGDASKKLGQERVKRLQ